MTARRRKPPSGFTLVELLVVILILAILFGLTLVGVMKGLETARRASMVTDIENLSISMEDYKNKNNDYPPALFGVPADVNRFNQHVRNVVPRYRGLSNNPYADFAVMADALTLPAGDNLPDPATLDPAESLVLWLGGVSQTEQIPGRPPITRLVGFSSNAVAPFSFTTGPVPSVQQPRPPLFEFTESRLVDRDADGWLEFAPDFRADTGPMPPLVYFDHESYASVIATPLVYPTAPALQQVWGYCVPYANDNGAEFMNAQSYQIIASGLDGQYGALNAAQAVVLRQYPIGLNYDPLGSDDDNLVNFTTNDLGSDAERAALP
jgi:prepilin-type N-terminal cleavage/methylation domain-containing protein